MVNIPPNEQKKRHTNKQISSAKQKGKNLLGSSRSSRCGIVCKVKDFSTIPVSVRNVVNSASFPYFQIFPYIHICLQMWVCGIIPALTLQRKIFFDLLSRLRRPAVKKTVITFLYCVTM